MTTCSGKRYDGRMLTEEPLHPDFLALQPGDWVQVMTPNSIRTGEVIRRSGISLLVHFQAEPEPQGIPYAEAYFSDAKVGLWGMRKIEPQRRIPAPGSHTMSVRQAAAKLGTDNKTIRRMLRDGTITGHREDGKWLVDSLDTAR